MSQAQATQQREWGFYVRFRDEPPLLLNVLATYVIGLQDLVWVAAASDVIHDVTRAAAASPGYETKVLRKAVDHAERTAGGVYAARISYSSPLELVFYIGGASGAVLTVGYKLLGMYDKFLDTRAKKADTDLRVTAMKHLEERLRATDGENDFGPLPQMFPGTQSRVTQSAETLAGIERLDVESRPDEE